MAQTVPLAAQLGPAQTGLTIEYQVYDLDGTTIDTAWTSTNVAETAVAGTYRVASGVSVDEAGAYVIFRRTSDNEELAFVTIEPAPPTAAEVNAEVDQALADYDGPTAAELAATQTAITNAIAALNNLSAAEVNAEVDTALADYDGPTAAELTATQTAITAAITALNNLSAAQVNAEVDQALADYDGPTNTEMVAAFTEIKGATWATTDTLEAIRDRGDAAWATATGFSTHAAADVWAVGTRTLTGFGTLIADIWAAATRTLTVGTKDSEIDAIKAQTDQVTFTGSDVNATLDGETVTVGVNNDKAGYSLSTAGAQAVWDALTSALTTASSIGKLLVDNIDATISSRLPTSSYTAPDNATIASIQADTDDLQTQIGTAGAGLTALGDTRLANLDAAVSSRSTVTTAEVNVEVDTALADYDGPTAAELAAAQAVITTAISTTESNIRGADSDTLETLSDQIDSGATAAAIWEHSSRTLTSTAAATVSAVVGSTLNITRAVTYEATLSGLNIPVTWAKLYFTMDDDNDLHLADSSARVQIVITNGGDAGDGLQYLNGAAATASQAALTVDQGAGTVDIVIEDEATQSLDCGAHKYDIKIVKSDGRTQVLTTGDANVILTPTGAVS